MDGNDDLDQYSRIPTIEDLVTLCRHLNDHQVKYVVVGGFAVIRFGYIRATGDIDLLVEDSPENIDKLRKALAYLPDGEADQITDTDLSRYRVVRVSGEITVDLIAKACDVTYSAASNHVQFDEIAGVKIPYLKPFLLIKTKLGVRPKDIQDRNFLQRLIDRSKSSRIVRDEK
jgi:predicted nucleotidyltransferase